MTTYDATLTDATGDDFDVTAEGGHVFISDTDPDENTTAADLMFDPAEAMVLASHLVRAATVAYAQQAEQREKEAREARQAAHYASGWTGSARIVHPAPPVLGPYRLVLHPLFTFRPDTAPVGEAR